MLEKHFDAKINPLICLGKCQQVYCFVDPCAFAKCDKHPEAVCKYVKNSEPFLYVIFQFFVELTIAVVVMPGFMLLKNELNAIKNFFSRIYKTNDNKKRNQMKF